MIYLISKKLQSLVPFKMNNIYFSEPEIKQEKSQSYSYHDT